MKSIGRITGALFTIIISGDLLIAAGAAAAAGSALTCDNACDVGFLALPSPDETPAAGCNRACHVEQCRSGCSLADLDAECGSECKNPTCMHGCRYGYLMDLHDYFAQISLVQMTKTNQTSASVEWSVPRANEALGWTGQYRSIGDVYWTTASPVATFKSGTNYAWTAVGLKSNSYYQIRIVCIWSGQLIYASPSATYKTLPASTGQADPPIIRYLSVGPELQFVCWESPKFASTPIVGYVMRLLRDGKLELEKSFEKGPNCYALTGLQAGLTYELQLQASGGIPVAQTLPVPAAVETGAIKSDLVFANATNAFLLGDISDFFVTNSPKVIFSAPKGSQITTLDASATTIYIGLTSGEVIKLGLADLRAETLLKIGENIADLSYDDLNRRLYALVGAQIYIISTVDGKLQRKFKLSAEDSKNIAVDGWNGFVYVSQATRLGQYDVVTGESTWNRTSFQKSSPSPVAVDYSQFSLFFADSTDANSPPSILARRFDTGEVADMRSVSVRHAGLQQSYADIGQLAAMNGRLFWVRKNCPDPASCLYSEERTADGQLAANAYVLPPGYGQLLDLAAIRATARPTDMEKPTDVGLLASATTVKATWRPPAPQPFQSKTTGFRELSYVAKLTKGGREVGSVPVTSETLAKFENLNPLTVYGLELQCCWAGVCSGKVTAKTTTLGVDKKYNGIVYAVGQDGKVIAVDFVGESKADTIATKLVSFAANMTCPPACGYWPCFGYQKNFCYSVLQPSDESRVFLPDPVSSAVQYPIACDSMVGRYCFQSAADGLQRVDVVQSNAAHLFPIAQPAKWADLLSLKGIVVLAWDFRLELLSYFGIPIDRPIYACDAAAKSAACRQILGIATDQIGSRIVLLTGNNSFVECATYDYESGKSETFGRVPSGSFPIIKQLAFANGKLFLLTDDGRMGITELNLDSIAYLPQSDVVAFAVRREVPLDTATLEPFLASNISLGNNSIAWDVDKRLSTSDTYFDVSVKKALIESESFYHTITSENRIPLLSSIPGSSGITVQVVPFNYWKSGQLAKSDLTTGSQIPTPPRSLTLFQTVIPYNGSQVYLLEAVWEPPSAWSGVPDVYRLQCDGGGLDVQLIMPSTVNHKQIHVDSQPPSGIQCSIVAKNDVGFSEATKSGSAQPGPPRIVSLHNQGKQLKIQYLNVGTAIKMDLSANPLTKIAQMDEPDLRQHAFNQMLFGAGADGKLYALEPHGLSFEVLTDGKAPIGSLAVDWVGRRVFYSVAEKIYVHELDSDRNIELASQTDSPLSEMAFDPLQSHLYFTQRSNRAPNAYELRALKIESQTLETTPAADQPLCGSLVSPALYLNYSESLIGRVVVVNGNGLSAWDGSQCVAGTTRLDFNQTTVEQILIDVPHLLARNANGSILVYSTSSNAWRAIDSHATYMVVSPTAQVWPDLRCFKLHAPAIDAIPQQDSVTVKLQRRLKADCVDLSQPVTDFTVQLHEQEKYSANSCDSANRCRVWNVTSPIVIEFSGLLPNTAYIIRVGYSNRYAAVQYMELLAVATTAANVTGIRNVIIDQLTPGSVMVVWDVPSGSRSTKYGYKIQLEDETSAKKTTVPESGSIACSENPCKYQLNKLQPGTDYLLRISVVQPPDVQLTSEAITFRTMQVPGHLHLEWNSSSQLVFRWMPKEDVVQPPQGILLLYRQDGANTDWKEVAMSNDQLFVLNNLRPDTQYEIRLSLNYANSFTYLVAPKRNRYSTLGFVPGPPTNPHFDPADNVTELHWSPPSANGHEVLLYRIQYRLRGGAWKNLTTVDGATTLYKLDILVNDTYEFQIAAINRQGQGPYQLFGGLGGSGNSVPIWVIAVVVILLVLLIAFLAVLFFACRRRKSAKAASSCKALEQAGRLRMTTGDEIASWKRIPPEELATLPQVPRGCITVARLIGKGAFGEVFEGLACNLPKVGPKSVRVAIKTLKPGADESERVKFLKEALVMSTFDHENIVKLLGVCLESEPLWIIIELMEAGDLLTYLRTVRPTDAMPSQVSMKDLLTMGVDVAQGCAYLEKNHHVHRDIAARNCLVTSRDPHLRVVKIADFGMTRDVYEDDYYRVEGQGLLPVRWMAPESMVDGVFTLKTDVWAYGVLLWEIMTLGQQPYQARTNWDVINYVRIGGRLSKPPDCPDQIHDLMLACWAFQPEDRPTFGWILQRLLTLKEVAELNSEVPFPPTFRGAVNHGFARPDSGGTGAGSRSGSGEVQIFTTPGSARFQRNIPATGSLKPMPKKRRKMPGFRSFRKAKAASSPQPPPSKHELERPTSPPRPVSGASSGMESYTTSRLSYEVPLLKNVVDETRTSLQPTSDYVSASSSGSLQGRSSTPRSLRGADNLAFEPTTPKSGGNVLPLHEYLAQTAGASSTQNQYVPSPATRKLKRAAPAAPSLHDPDDPDYQPSSQRNSLTRTARTSDV